MTAEPRRAGGTISGTAAAQAGAAGRADARDVAGLVDSLTARLKQADLNLKLLKHNGFKDFTEGPSEDTPVLLRQDAYKALTEPVTFTNPDGTTTPTVPTSTCWR